MEIFGLELKIEIKRKQPSVVVEDSSVAFGGEGFGTGDLGIAAPKKRDPTLSTFVQKIVEPPRTPAEVYKSRAVLLQLKREKERGDRVLGREL